jgi:hypothetical protein
MNYYPNNFYQNYSYGNMYQPQQAQPAVAALQGKVVDSVDMVRVNEVPFGGFGVFPKGDLSEIYVKSWNNNGTTQINTYKPIPVEETKEAKEISSRDELLEKINALNEKLDALMNSTAKQASTPAAPAAAKVVKVNAY